MNTYGLGIGFDHTEKLTSFLGQYYQYRDQEHIDGSGINGRLAHNIGNDLSVATNISYEDAFDKRVSAEFKYRLRLNGKGKNDTQSNIIKAL